MNHHPVRVVVLSRRLRWTRLFELKPKALPNPACLMTSSLLVPKSMIALPSVQHLLPCNIEPKLITAHRFQQYYAHQVPLLEDAKVPNDYYNRSPLLFWTIVAIGSRRYSKNPVLISSLAPGVKALAREGIFTRDAPISTVASTIISAILLATWPIPFDTLWREETPILLGAAFQLGLSIGLHVYGVGQDFSRIKLAQDKAQMDYRARVWTVLLYTYQRSVAAFRP